MGLGARSVVIILSGSLCVWRSPLEYSGYSLLNTSLLSPLEMCAVGGLLGGALGRMFGGLL